MKYLKYFNIHRYYSVNFFIYLVFISFILLCIGFIALECYSNFFVASIGLVLYTLAFLFLMPINLMIIIVEFILKKQFGFSKELDVVLQQNQLKFIYVIVLFMLLGCITFQIYDASLPVPDPRYD